MLSEGGRTSANIDDDIEYFTDDRAHQFPLRLFDLVVQTTQYAPDRFGMIVLHKILIACGGMMLLILLGWLAFVWKRRVPDSVRLAPGP